MGECEAGNAASVAERLYQSDKYSGGSKKLFPKPDGRSNARKSPFNNFHNTRLTPQRRRLRLTNEGLCPQ